MNWLLLLYNVLLGVVILDATANALAAVYMFRLRLPLARKLGWVFAAAMAEALFTALSMGMSPTPQRIIAWMVAARIVTRLFKTATVGKFALWLLVYVNGDHPEAKDNAQ